MKRFFILAMAGWLLFPTASRAVETAHARLYCYSLRFTEGTDGYGDTLDLSTLGGPPYNGELLPYSGNEWASGLALEIYFDNTIINGALYVNLPSAADADGDGFDDFFEVAQGVSAATSGHYSTDLSSGDIIATWTRNPGSATGQCVFNFNDDTFGDLGDYTCPFTLLEYTGALTYTPGSNSVSASINLTQTGNPANTLQGAVNFDKSAADQFNTLTNQPGVWTNAALQTLAFDSEVFSRDAAWPTNYYGYVYFSDGDPATGDADYQLWLLSIDDTNDADADGFPDFSDDPASVTPPRAPTLALALGQTNLLLTISGDIGRTNLIQEIDSLTSADWQTALTLTLTNNPQTVSLPLPSGRTRFWRVLAQ